MTLDLPTIVALLLVSSGLMSLTLWLGARRDHGAGGTGKWNLGLGLIALAWLLVAARGAVPAAAGHALADALMLAGLCFQIAALMELDGRKAPTALLVAPPALLVAAGLALFKDFPGLGLVVGLAFAVTLGVVAGLALRDERSGALGVRRMMAALYAIAALAVLVRTAHVQLHAFSFLALFAMTVGGSFSFLILQRERSEATMRRLASTDALTELLNRHAFSTLGERMLGRALREAKACAVLMIDLDGFGRVNEEFGRLAGDRVLAAFGALLKRCLRPNDLAGRHGGEEFCVLLADVSEQDAHHVAERIRRAACEAPLGGLPRTVTASVGVVPVLPRVGGSLDTVLAAADEALRAVKRLPSEGKTHADARHGLAPGGAEAAADVIAAVRG
jgi:diguanylate cyclase (GGDEF)-like protein